MTNLWRPDQQLGPNLPVVGLPDPVDRTEPGVGRLVYKEPFMGGHTWHGPAGLFVIATMDETSHGRLLHVSISRRDNDPPWGVIKGIRDAFYPADVDVMMVLPRREDYINVHRHTFHLWQCPARWGIR